MATTGPPLVLTMTVPETRSEPAPRRTTPLGTWRVDETLYLPAERATTWFLPVQPLRAFWMADVASPLVVPTVTQTVARTGSPSLPRGLPVGVSERIPGCHVVV